MRARIDFAALAAALLDRAHLLVPAWLPQGQERHGRWYVGDFDGQAGESANVNLRTGQWIDNAAPDEECGGDLISLYARLHNLNNGQAALALMDELGWQRPQDDGPAPRALPAPAPAPVATAAAPVAPVGGPAAVPAPAAATGPKWRAVVPVPPHAPAPGFRFSYKDKKSNAWVELDAVAT